MIIYDAKKQIWGNVQKKFAEKEKDEEEKLDRESKTKTQIISDSTLRKADATKTNADIICISGGLIDHLVNSLYYNEKALKYDNFVIVGGLNNIDQGENKETERTQTYKQLKDLGNSVRELLDSEKQFFCNRLLVQHIVKSGRLFKL